MSGAVQLPPGPRPLPPAAAETWDYAGFWWRALAWLADTVLISLASRLLAVGPSWAQDYLPKSPGRGDWGYNWATAEPLSWPALATLAYFVLFHSSRLRATPGKLLCGLIVVDEAGHRIGLGRALGRELAKFLSALILFVGFLMAGWTRRKQALHDLLAGTLVLKRRAPPAFAGLPPGPPSPW